MRPRAPLAGALALLVLCVLAALAQPGLTQAPPGAPVALPHLGVPDPETVLMGAARDGEPGEVWGYRVLPLETPPPVASGRAVEFGPRAPGAFVPQLAFLRHTDATGWQVHETPADADGRPYRGPAPNPLSASVTPRGGGILVGRDPRREAGEQSVLLVRDPGGRFRERPVTPGVREQDEDLGTDQGAGRVASVAYPVGDRTGAFVALAGPEVEDAILHFDGTTFRREAVLHEPGTVGARVTHVDATSPENAWALVESEVDEATGDPQRGVELYRRGAAGTWARLELEEPVFDDRDTPAAGVSGVTALRDAADALSVTADGVWVDGTLTASGSADPAAEGEPHTFTLFVEPEASGADRLAASWCDAPRAGDAGERVCDRRLGVGLSTGIGYRSFAFPGPGFGTRVVTNPVVPGGGDDTNRGTFLRFDGDRFARVPGGAGNRRRSGAFTSTDEGWLEGPVQITRRPAPARLRRWPVPARAPFTDATPAPGVTPGALESPALAVGADGVVARYTREQGWTREFLLTPSGGVSRPRLRGVAWPEPGRAHAVGDGGAMWQWRQDLGQWERDPAAPVGFEANLLDVAFQPGNPERGFAVGRAGTLLRYDKTWLQDAPPPEAAGRDLTGVDFAGGQALVAAGPDLLVNDGGGWRVDEQVRALLAGLPGTPYLRAVDGLPDGGAVVAGRGFVLERDGAGAPWRFADQPLLDQTVVAAAAFRDGGRVRAVVSVQPRLPYPELDDPVAVDPDVPPPILPPQPLPGDGYLLRETASGWRDEQRSAFPGSSTDRPLKTDPVLAFVLGPDGQGWAIGGWGGDPDFAGRGTPQAADRARVQTAGVFRYAAEGDPPPPPAVAAAPVPQPGGVVRLAVGGHAQCEEPCADLANQGIAPDRMLQTALLQASELARRPGGPAAFLYTGGRLRPQGTRPLPGDEAARYAELLSTGSLPAFAAPSEGDTAGDTAGTFVTAMAGRPAPFGEGPPPPGLGTGGIPGAAPGPGARTHYAFDVARPEGTLRVAVIDNSRGSLAASDPHQNPREPQLPWLRAVLADARSRGIATVVMGSRDLSRFRPRLNVASDGDEVANVLLEGGASAYFFERPEENRAIRIPSGAARTIPAYGTGTLGYRSPVRDPGPQDVAASLFGDGVILLAEVDLARRDPATNVAPVGVRALPVVEDVALEATDGTLLRRSRPSLFQGLGRRPQEGDRWGEPSGDAGPSPPGGDPYTRFPSEQCVLAGCDTRITPEFEFASSDPDIGDFVRQDPESTNLRKPFIDPATDRVVTDPRSSLFCPFNAGTTTVTIRSGGLSASQQVTVLAGSVQRPCGTRPLRADRFRTQTAVPPAVQVPDLPAAAPASPPTPDVRVPPPPPAPVPPVVRADPPARPERPTAPQPGVPAPVFPAVPRPPGGASGAPPSSPPPPLGGFAQPIPPGTVSVRVLEERREEEAAPEQSQAFARHHAGEGPPVTALTLAALVLLAAAGASVRPRPGARGRRRPAYATARVHPHVPRTTPRSRR